MLKGLTAQVTSLGSSLALGNDIYERIYTFFFLLADILPPKCQSLNFL